MSREGESRKDRNDFSLLGFITGRGGEGFAL